MANEQYYVEFIQKVWQGALGASTSDINDDVKSVANTVFLEIQKCSRAFLATNILYELFYTTTGLWDLIVNLVISTGTGSISSWVDVLLGNATYRVCITSTALKWKSVMAMALAGIYRKSDAEIAEYLKAHPELGTTTDKEIKEAITIMRQVQAVKSE